MRPPRILTLRHALIVNERNGVHTLSPHAERIDEKQILAEVERVQTTSQKWCRIRKSSGNAHTKKGRGPPNQDHQIVICMPTF